eukprot:PhF_6_TR891/c0_g2_i1/m.1397
MSDVLRVIEYYSLSLSLSLSYDLSTSHFSPTLCLPVCNRLGLSPSHCSPQHVFIICHSLVSFVGFSQAIGKDVEPSHYFSHPSATIFVSLCFSPSWVYAFWMFGIHGGWG